MQLRSKRVLPSPMICLCLLAIASHTAAAQDTNTWQQAPKPPGTKTDTVRDMRFSAGDPQVIGTGSPILRPATHEQG